jgi:DNA-binding CsgD family transcriptional regulator
VRYTELLTLGATSGAVPGVPELERLRALGLTDRQAEVLQILATGATERDIGDRLGISYRTVQKHLQRCYRQLGVSNRSRAAAIAWSTIDPAGG